MANGYRTVASMLVYGQMMAPCADFERTILSDTTENTVLALITTIYYLLITAIYYLLITAIYYLLITDIYYLLITNR